MADTPDRAALRDAVREVCDQFDDHYWGELDRTHTFPHEFTTAMARGLTRSRRPVRLKRDDEFIGNDIVDGDIRGQGQLPRTAFG